MDAERLFRCASTFKTPTAVPLKQGLKLAALQASALRADGQHSAPGSWGGDGVCRAACVWDDGEGGCGGGCTPGPDPRP
eukprot:3329242-Rhodomonas_salina.1